MKRWASAVVLAALVAGGAPAAGVPAPDWLEIQTSPPEPSASGLASRASNAACHTPDHPFNPTSIAIPRVIGPTRVLALGRDGAGVPKPPPLTETGKWAFAWDKQSHIRPGTPHGVVRLSAHTYPRDGSYGLALGNQLLDHLRNGTTLVASGSDGQRMCYRVAKRISVPSDQPLPAYYSSRGHPRLAIVVCSGVRRGPGDWSHRTVWFAVARSHG